MDYKSLKNIVGNKFLDSLNLEPRERLLPCLFNSGPSPELFFVYFCLFEQTVQSLQKINVINFLPVYGR